MSNIHSGKCCV